MDKEQNKMLECLYNLSAEQATNAFLDFYGTRLLDSEFMQFLVDEGYMPDSNED